MNFKALQLIQERNYAKTTKKSWNTCAQELKAAQDKQKEFEAMIKHYKQKLLDLSEGKSTVGEEFYYHKIVARGSVQYDKIPELQGVDLDQYRKDDNEYWKLDTL